MVSIILCVVLQAGSGEPVAVRARARAEELVAKPDQTEAAKAELLRMGRAILPVLAEERKRLRGRALAPLDELIVTLKFRDAPEHLLDVRDAIEDLTVQTKYVPTLDDLAVQLAERVAVLTDPALGAAPHQRLDLSTEYVRVRQALDVAAHQLGTEWDVCGGVLVIARPSRLWRWPSSGATPREAERWVQALESGGLDERERAARELLDLGDAACAAVERLAESADGEARARAREVASVLRDRYAGAVFAPGWRSALDRQALGDAQRAAVGALSAERVFGWRSVRLDVAMRELSRLVKVPLTVDERLAEVRVTLRGRVSAREALGLVCRSIGADVVWRDGRLWVVPPAEAEKVLTGVSR